ncbi:uncharacterized protein [Typha latifolia]|uniref:uncharacterized protein n=1 Tax=Typha latifolia TaxID=4733 RepID=UPI003C2E5EFE
MERNKANSSFDTHVPKINGGPLTLNPALDFLVQVPQKLQNSLKIHFKHLLKKGHIPGTQKPLVLSEEQQCMGCEVNLDKQLQAWKNNSNWFDEPAEIKVNVPKGSLCNLKVRFKAGLPPDAIYNIVVDPENKRVFKNIKEVISRRVVLDEGFRQVVELEQAAIWKFLWWSGTISVHVYVDQNRKDHTVSFKQGRSGFMKKFEGCWKVEPLFIDEQICLPHKPKTLVEYEACTRGNGRVGSIVTLDQLIQPAVVPPPPISWYLRGITTRTTEMLITDLLAEVGRLRRAATDAEKKQYLEASGDSSSSSDLAAYTVNNIKERWRERRNRGRRGTQ